MKRILWLNRSIIIRKGTVTLYQSDRAFSKADFPISSARFFNAQKCFISLPRNSNKIQINEGEKLDGRCYPSEKEEDHR